MYMYTCIKNRIDMFSNFFSNLFPTRLFFVTPGKGDLL